MGSNSGFGFSDFKGVGLGTGLGLSVSNNIVLAYSGIIECKSKGSGQGALFRVILPLVEDSA